MRLPAKYREIILSGMEPGETYRKCIVELGKDAIEADYRFTEIIVYATEVRYAIDVLTKGRPERFWNFGDLQGDANERLWEILDPIELLKIAFVGSGPYPVTAFLLRERYPYAAITCIENNFTAHFLSEAVIDRLGMNITTVFEEAIDVDYRGFNVVIVAAMVTGKREVVEKILRTSDARVILRGRLDLVDDRLIQLGSTFREDGGISGAEVNPTSYESFLRWSRP